MIRTAALVAVVCIHLLTVGVFGGESNHRYKDGETVTLWVNKVRTGWPIGARQRYINRTCCNQLHQLLTNLDKLPSSASYKATAELASMDASEQF